MAKHDDTGAYYDDEVKEERHQSKENNTTAENTSSRRTTLIICILFFIGALAIRLFYLLFVTDPNNPGAGWFGDSYHHWQIGYLTQQLGWQNGFLRAWDLKGMDLFWGLLHPTALAILFAITGNSSMALERGMTCAAGAFSVVLIYLLGRKYWNEKVGIAAALMTAFCSVIIFNDATGMVEPLGIPFLLGALYTWPRKPFLTGLFFGIALLTRSEFWIFSIGLIAALIIFDIKSKLDHKVLVILGFMLVLLPYMKYLLDYTGNPIYPFYENFMKNIAGEWQYKKTLEPADLHGQFLFRVILGITMLVIALVMWRKPKGWQMHLLGLGSWLFLGLTFGVSNYIKSWADYVWVVRFMLLPYTYLIIALAVLIFYYIPSIVHILSHPIVTGIKFLAVLGFIALSQLAWIEIYKYYTPTQKTWNSTKTVAAAMAVNYKGGKILLPEGSPDLTYALAQYHNILGKDMLSEMYDPLGYAEQNSTDAIAHWNEVDELNKNGYTYREEMLEYIKNNNVKYFITYANRERYLKLIELEPELFSPASPNTLNFASFYVHPEKL